MTAADPHAHHSDVGAYAIGVLDPADAARFEEHLAVCSACGRELEELLGLGPVLAEYAQDAPDTDTLTARPGPGLLEGLLRDVAATARRRRGRRLALVAAAVVLLVAGPVAGAAWSERDGTPAQARGAAEVVFADGDKLTATDPGTRVAATVSTVPRAWGTEIAVRLAGVTGPQTCGLVAVGKDGTEQTVTTWSVPAGGYGWEEPHLYVGGAAYDRSEIARFEVRTLDGEHLVTVPG
ncbi:zf-HC2 domain-containing protein [Streptomyces sp. GSL17-111]|uniref:zf-HC2 domain-containing protein n=1 Tax=Streptomyces sp. GSL17-111 TaxID=3121596 RepID=UPI0030F3F5D7